MLKVSNNTHFLCVLFGTFKNYSYICNVNNKQLDLAATAIRHKVMKLYHGTSEKFTINKNRCLYLTPDINVARDFALGLDSEGNYNEESYIYEMDIDENLVTEEDDFMYFDGIGYSDYENMPEIVHNSEFDFYCVKHPEDIRLIDHYRNSL